MLLSLRSATAAAGLCVLVVTSLYSQDAGARTGDVFETSVADSGFTVALDDGRSVTLRLTEHGLAIERRDGENAVTKIQGLGELIRATFEPRDVAVRAPQDAVRVFSSDTEIGPGETVTGVVLVTEGNARILGRVNGSVVSLRGDVTVRSGGRVTGDILAPRGVIRVSGGEVGGRQFGRTWSGRSAVSHSLGETWEGLVTLVGIVLALMALGFGGTLLAPSNLATGAETISSALGRSVAAGLLGQALLIPTLITLTVGLALTIVGVIVIPFAVAAFVVLTGAAAMAGFLSVFRAVGERLAERGGILGRSIPAQSSFGHLLAGLLLFAAIWLVAILFHWAPVAGEVLLGLATLVTWVAFTAGFGAALLSRLGTRDSYAGRVSAQLTDEYLWPTPIATPAASRPKRRDR